MSLTWDEYKKIVPEEFVSLKAHRFFSRACEAGIILAPGAGAAWTVGPGYSKGSLTYFCERACKLLGLNCGSQTYWAPFEDMFGESSRTFRSRKHNLDESQRQEDLKDKIDAFFESLEAPEIRTVLDLLALLEDELNFISK